MKYMTAVVNKGGRPFGSVETPHTLLQRELRATIKTLTLIRDQIEKQFLSLSNTINSTPNNSVDQHLDAMEKMTNIMIALTKNVETLGKYSIGDASRRRHPVDEDTGKEASVDIRKILGSR
jgi:hypothetical protein